MKNHSRDMYTIVRSAFEELTPLVKKVRDGIRNEADIVELADYAFAIRETRRLLEELVKELNAGFSLAEKKTCLLYLNDPTYNSTAQPIRTDYCTVTPDVKMMASLPRKSTDPEGYAALMQFMGVPAELWMSDDPDSEAVRPHWPGMVTYLTNLAKEGKPFPPGIDPDKMYPHYKLGVRSRLGGPRLHR